MSTQEPKTMRRILNVATAVVVIAAILVVVRIVTQHTALAAPPTSAQTLVFAPNGQTVYVADQGTIDVVKILAKGSTTTGHIGVTGGSITHLAITPNGHQLLVATATTGTSTGTVSVVDLAASPGQAQATVAMTGHLIESLAVAPDGSFALIGESGPFVVLPPAKTAVEVGPGTVDRIQLGQRPALAGPKVKVGYGLGALAIGPGSHNAFVLNHGLHNRQQGEQLTSLQLTTSPLHLLGSVAVTGAGLMLSPSGLVAYTGSAVVNLLADPPQLQSPPTPPPGLTSLSGFSAQSISPDGRYVYLSGGQTSGAGGLDQVVEDTTTTPPTSATFNLTDCTNALVNPQGTHVYCGSGLVYPLVPSITSFSVAVGGLAGGYPVTLHGAFLYGVTSVNFGRREASIRSVSSKGDTITVIAPKGPLGPVPVTVTTSGGINPSVPASSFTYAALPSVSALTPRRGLIQGGTGVLLGGSGFIGATAVDFGPGHPAKILSITHDGTLMAVRAPPGALTVNVTVTNAHGTSLAAGGNRFRFVKLLPSVGALAPNSGKSGIGLLIGGKRMNAATSVDFGTVPAKILSVSGDGDFVAVTVPPGAGSVDVTVTTPSGTSNDVKNDEFTYK
ncbi:MAG TPA: IPT/TIG domain-containing protein [Acidimicrobiales bacterium]|jgi:hypothetical protein|nr:IPT/TIG domain-containing protein [Acidimicrobiales bacterium]